MPFARTCLLAALALSLPTAAPAAAPPAAEGPSPAQIARWVKELAADDFEMREAASKSLRAAGRAAEPALLAAAASGGDLETVRRARDVLKEFRWGIYPDTPKVTRDLILEYQSAARSEKLALIKRLASAGPPGAWALTKIATAEGDLLARREVFAQVANELPKMLPAHLANGNLDGLDGLMELAVASEDRVGVGHYAAYRLLRGDLDERIRLWEALARAHPTGKPQAEVLAYLFRARGDLKSARRAAQKAERSDLEEAFLYEAADWRELARRPDLIGTPNAVEKLGYRTAYARLSGNAKALANVLAELRKSVPDLKRQPEGILPLAKVFFLNGRPGEALELLADGENEPLRFEVLLAQAEVSAALAVVAKARKKKSADLPVLELLEARALHGLGEKAKALAILKRYGEQIKPGTDASWFEDLVEAEVKLGRREQALAHCVLVLATSKDQGWPAQLFKQVFPDKKGDAELLWKDLRRANPAEPADKAFGRLRALLDGKAGEKEVAALMGGELDRKMPRQMWLAMASAALACKQEARAIAWLETATVPEGELRLGDLYARKGAWAKAARRYEKAYELALKRADAEPVEDVCTPELALYLAGHADVKAGQAERGARRMEQAHWLPLGDGHARWQLGRALEKRGHVAAARREAELLRRVGEPTLTERASFYTGEGFSSLANEELRRQRFLKAADAFEQASLRCLRPYVNFVVRGSYVGVPGMIHRARARGLLSAGKVDEALAEAALARAALPGNTEVAVRLVPELEKRGRKKEAALLFAQALAVQEKLCRDWPRCARAHNAAAWLAVSCGRNLDQALVHGRKAVELEPKRAAYQDTLAEALFQSGRKAEAVAAQKRAVELAPGRDYFRRQLRRIEAGDPKALRPNEEDE